MILRSIIKHVRKRLRFAVGSNFMLVLFGAVITIQAAEAQSPNAEPACSESPHAAAVTAQRERFNSAIRERDIDTINAILTDDVVLVTGTDSDVYTGSVRQLALWARDFQSDERLIYVRTPLCIDISSQFPIALEAGRWRGMPEAADDAASFAEGRYSAKWRRENGAWRLEVEIYMTDRCGGAICPESDAEP